jgi:hypothetical protein
MLVFWAPTNEILAVACPNKVVGITPVPSVNSGRMLFRTPVFRKFWDSAGGWFRVDSVGPVGCDEVLGVPGDGFLEEVLVEGLVEGRRDRFFVKSIGVSPLVLLGSLQFRSLFGTPIFRGFRRVSAPGLKWGGWLSNHSSKWRALVSEVKSLAKIEEVLVEGLVGTWRGQLWNLGTFWSPRFKADFDFFFGADAK